MTNRPPAEDLLATAAAAALEALAENPVALDVSNQFYFADIFLILTADNPRHSRSVVDEVNQALKKTWDLLPRSVEGSEGAGWVVLDYGDLVVHVFLPEDREFYGLERLWSEGRPLPVAADQNR